MEKITHSQYLRSVFLLPAIEKEGQEFVINVDDVPIKYVAKEGLWELRDFVIVAPAEPKLKIHCTKKCDKVTVHKINKSATKVRCTICEEITDIKL